MTEIYSSQVVQMNINRPIVLNYGTEETLASTTSADTIPNGKAEVIDNIGTTKKKVSFESKPTKATKSSAAKKRRPKPKGKHTTPSISHFLQNPNQIQHLRKSPLNYAKT
jgi:hypothetical protein